jgi:RimJ/RimL family protein N-acetyltransferase
MARQSGTTKMARRGGVCSERLTVVDVTLTPLTEDHFPLLVRWLNEPHVQAWWRDGTATTQSIRAKYGPRVGAESATACFVIEADGAPVGLIQHYRHADYAEWDTAVGVPAAAGTDYLVGDPAYTGKGVGSAAIALAADLALAAYPEVACVVAVPQADNTASRRALEKAGFQLREIRDLDSDDPSDAGPGAVYVMSRPR